MARTLALLAATTLLAATLDAQICTTGTLMKNDTLPAVPTGPIAVAVIAGLSQDDAAATILATGGPSIIHEVGVMLGNYPTGASGFSIVVDVEIYDGVTDQPGGTYAFGPMIWSLSGSLSQNAQIFSHAINTIAIPNGVRTIAPRVAIAIRILQNLHGSCGPGYTTNLATDNTACSSSSYGKNALHLRSDFSCNPPNLWVDPQRFPPLCAFGIYNGNWIIRACVVPDIQTRYTGNATPGAFLSLEFKAPNNPNAPYLVFVSGGTTPGLDLRPIWPTTQPIAMNLDGWFNCFLGACRGLILAGSTGVLNASGDAFGVLSIPNSPGALGITWYMNFVVYDPLDFFTWRAVSPPSPAIAIH